MGRPDRARSRPGVRAGQTSRSRMPGGSSRTAWWSTSRSWTSWASRASARGPAAHYRTVKLYLDLATSLLLFAGAYAPTYRERAARLARLADAGARPDLPAGLARLAERVDECTRAKLEGHADAAPMDLDWREAVAATRRVWRWELARLTGSAIEGDALGRGTPGPLARAAAARRSAPRLALRRPPPRLAPGRGPLDRRAPPRRRASPRYCVYAAASALFFRLPELCGREDAGRLRSGADAGSRSGPTALRRGDAGLARGRGRHALELPRPAGEHACLARAP